MALEWLSIASVWFKKAKGFNLYYSNWLIVVTAIIEMEQFVWGLTLKPYVIQIEFSAKFARTRCTPRRPLDEQKREKLFL